MGDNKLVQQILCGIDGSAPACRAIEFAACLARDLKANLSFVSVAKPMAMTRDLEDYVRAEGIDYEPVPFVEEDAQACLDTARKISGECGIDHAEYTIKTGEPLDQLMSLVRQKRADILILGHHARSSATRLLRKPLSQQIADEGTVKLLLVP